LLIASEQPLVCVLENVSKLASERLVFVSAQLGKRRAEA
jgi:hypothetical protein